MLEDHDAFGDHIFHELWVKTNFFIMEVVVSRCCF
jgi:hypothetical protein